MKKNIKNSKSQAKFLSKIGICLALLFVIFLSKNASSIAFAAENEFCYLSDIPAKSSVVGDKTLLLDKNYNGNLITVSVDGEDKSFFKGIFAHAASTVIYDLSDYQYDYFTAYIGVDIANRAKNEGDGVKFKIYTSQDEENWTEILNDNNSYKSTTDAKFVELNIKNAKYLKLVAEAGRNNWSDHAVYANAKLIKEGYVETEDTKVDFIKTVSEYDQIIKSHQGEEITGDYELVLLQREFVNNFGYDYLQFLATYNNNYKETVQWLMTDVENLRLYILGGTPAGGSYYNSLVQLSRLYDEYSSDFTNNELLNNKWYPNMTYGDLYKKMAITLSLTHSQNVGLWMQSGAKENKSDALRRYAIYKYLHKEGRLRASSSIDLTPLFEALQVEEMRFVMNNMIDDEEILWLNSYVKTKIVEQPAKAWLTPHPHIAYIYPNYGNAVYYADENKDYFNELFAVKDETISEAKIGLFDLEYTIPGGKNTKTYTIKVTRGTPDYKLYKVWMNFRNKFGTGAVCGGISKSGSNIRATHGIPATVIGQPGHAALLFYSKNAEGKGYWGIDNDVSGWTLSEKGERMMLGWGNATYSRGYSVVYMVLAQEAINDYENLVKCEEKVMLAKVYAGDLTKQEEIYRKALEIQPINIDAWYGLINVYNANTNKTEDAYYALAEELAEKLKCFPLPMYHLTNLIKPKLTSVENIYKFTLLQTRILTEGSKLPNTATDQVLQPAVTRVEANYLLGKLDKNIATFSFDGVDAGKIMLASKFDGNGIRWDYSLDGKQTWKEVAFTGEEEHKWQLTREEIASITAENDIYIHIVGVNYDESNLYKIDITDQALLSNLYANDLENSVIGVNSNTEWRYTENDEWTLYSISSPDLTGDKTVQVRQGATGTKMASNASPIYTFTADNQPDTAKYIRIAHLSIEEYSTQSKDGKRPYYAPNAIDGNMNTMWHTDFAINVLQSEQKPFITIKLDEPRYVSALEFTQWKYTRLDPAFIKNAKVYVSIDGENWNEAGKIENCPQTEREIRRIDFDESIYGQYVKLEMETYDMFASLAMVNLFEDITKIDNTIPTAEIHYSTRESTNQNVIASLVNSSTEITITNNNGSDTYIFTENGEFTFEFVDRNGNKGYCVATVNWIDTSLPAADVEYKLSSDKKLLILLDNISEDVYLLDENNNKINYVEVQNGKISNITYLDNLGNEYKMAEIDENGDIKKITYKNTTGNVSSVDKYVTTLTNGVITNEEYFGSEGESITITDAEKEILRGLQQAISNPLEQVLEISGEYKFKLLDKASNITYKSIKVDYIHNDTKILASDITYDITKATNKNVVATINPYIINSEGEKVNCEMVSENGKTYTFTDNGEFTFKYKDVLDTENLEVKEHTAKVTWIDKDAPTAQITYSSKEDKQKAVATLVNESEEIIITNNGTSREYTFTENGDFTFEFVDKAGNKGSATATVTWIEKTPDVPKEITSKVYRIEEGFISRIAPETTINKFKENVETEQDLMFLNKDGNELGENDILATGMTVKVGSNLQFTLIITGDLDGNGKITITDLAKLKLHYIEKELVTGIQLMAADIDGNRAVSITDFAQMKLVMIGKMEIK